MSAEFTSRPAAYEVEPTATHSGVPVWMIVLTLVLFYLGAVYFDFHGGFGGKVYAPYASDERLNDAQPQSEGAAGMAQGRKYYQMVCSVCHGENGEGKPGQAPPLAGSEIVIAKGFNRLAMIPLQGLAGPITVRNQDWNLSMAPMGAGLSDPELAAVLTYLRSSWGNEAGAVTAEDVKNIRARINNPAKPLNAETLMSVPE